MKKELLPNLKECTTHGDALSPYAFYHCSIPDTFTDLMVHWHDEAEITIIRDGSAIYQIGKETYYVKKGDLIFISPGTLHAIHETDEHHLISDSLVFHMNLLGCQNPDALSITLLLPILNKISSMNALITSVDIGYSDFSDCMEHLFCCIKKEQKFFELEMKESLFRLFYLLYSNHYIHQITQKEKDEYFDEKLKEVLIYIESHYDSQIYIHELSSICGFSDTHFMNFFKKSSGISCMEYIVNYRLNIAASLLSSSNDSIMSIALDTGFRNVSYFNRQFLQKFHVTPTEFRHNLETNTI